MHKILAGVSAMILIAVAQLSSAQEPSHKLRSFLDKAVTANYQGKEMSDTAGLISALGALAGFAVQEGLRTELVRNKGIPIENVFTVVQTKDGATYYFGPFFDPFLFDSENGTDFWSVLTRDYAGADGELTSIESMAEHNAKMVGKPKNTGHPPIINQ